MHASWWGVILGIAICAATARATPPDDEPDTSPTAAARRFVRAAELLKQQQWSAAESELERCLRTWPKHPDISALLGVARYHQGKHPEAHGALVDAIEGGTRYMARALYYDGMVLARLNQMPQAQGRFERLLVEFPSSAEAAQVNAARRHPVQPPGSLDPLDPPTSPTPEWRLEVSIGTGVDTNPRLESALFGTSAGNTLQADGTFTSLVDLVLRPAHTPLEFHADVFYRKYFNNTALDVLGLIGKSAVQLELSSTAILSPFVDLRHTWLDERSFEWRGGVGADFAAALTVDLALGANLTWAYGDYSAEFTGFDGWRLDGRVALFITPDAGMSPFRLAPSLFAFVVRTNVATQRYAGLGVEWMVKWQASATLGVAINFRWRHDTYLVVDSTVGRQRDDDCFTITLTPRADLMPWCAVWVSLEATLNRSTLGVASYDQFTASLTIAFRY